MSSEVLRVCARCGRVVPAARTSCGEHGDDTPAPREVARRNAGAYWGRVAFFYPCTACKARVAFTSLAPDGRSTCASCGEAGELSLVLWRRVLWHAHAVADLAGPDGEGGIRGRPSIASINPHRHVGLDVAAEAGEPMAEADDGPTGLVAGPGHPLCASCGELVDPAWRGGDASCACGAAVRGQVPAIVHKVDRAVIALLSPPPTVGAAAPGAVISLRCPTCNAPLEPAAGADRVVCRFCRTPALIAAAATTRRRVEPAALWLLFSSPSNARKELETKASRE
jgi:hypothetical protein